MELLISNPNIALFWGLTVTLVGKILISITVVMVHTKITKEKHIDGIVLMEMKRERIIAITGIALMVLGYVLELAGNGLI